MQIYIVFNLFIILIVKLDLSGNRDRETLGGGGEEKENCSRQSTNNKTDLKVECWGETAAVKKTVDPVGPRGDGRDCKKWTDHRGYWAATEEWHNIVLLCCTLKGSSAAPYAGSANAVSTSQYSVL
ncbi:hypothetical protein RRG08_017368 [Elysia crispata]|uniref:Uncharacterized protein n=1 Tax=Elysia crispata TaxID=231223 RepID=A0AAE1AKN3_9GAST|nr:hypothetical protein RRG08_017368 [Elysia crispata]